jgi:signal transduction histidine kinase
MKKRRTEPNNPVSRDRLSSAGFSVLARELLHYANQGLLKREYLPIVAARLLEHSGCGELELWVDEGNQKYYRCCADHAGKLHTEIHRQAFPFDSMGKGGADDRKYTDSEWLLGNVIHSRLAFTLPFITDYGSFWTNDTEKDIDFKIRTDGKSITRRICLKGVSRALALIPLMTEEHCVGLLCLKSMTPGFFSEIKIKFYEDIAQTLVVALAHQYSQIELRERVKELTCLYGIAKVVAQPNASFEETMQGIVELLPPAWLYPEIASARIVLERQTFSTPGFRETPYIQSSDVVVDERRVGSVELAYAEKRYDLDEGPFLSEERSLISIVAREVAHFYGRMRAEEEKSFLQEQLRHADRLATIGQLAAGVAHELNEPLGNILGFAQLTQKSPGLQEQTRKDLDKIVSASLHGREIIKKLMVFARQLPPQNMPVNLNKIVEDGIFFFEARCAKAGIELVQRFSQDLPEITADPGQLNQVLVNLVVNAIQAMPEGGVLTVETQTAEDHALLIVEDTGMGMTEKVKKQIFVPFFTTKDVNEGTGLGLPVVHGIVTSHRGSIVVKSRVGAGARFEIRLPAGGPPGEKENV